MNVKIGFSFGLLAIVIAGAVTLGVFGLSAVGLYQITTYCAAPAAQCCPCGPNCDCGPNCKCTPGHCVCPSRVAPVTLVKPKGKFEESHSSVPLPEVNEAARNEIKSGCSTCYTGQCFTGQCYRQPTYYQPQLPVVQQRSQVEIVASQYGATLARYGTGMYAILNNGAVWSATNLGATQAFLNPNDLIAQMQRGTRAQSPMANGQPPQPQRVGVGDKPTQPYNRSQISLFLLPGDPQSQRLKEWFATHPTLADWRSKCTYQEYTPDNRIYQTMVTPDGRALRQVVPVSEFPAVVVTAPDGGHIHAAGKWSIPDTADLLVSDVQKGHELKSHMPNEANSGLIRTAGYSWDDAISSDLKLQDCVGPNCPYPPRQPDCVGPNCPYPPNQPTDQDRWYPGSRVVDLFAKPKTGIARDALWGWADILANVFIAAMVCALVAFGIVCFGAVVLVLVFIISRKK